MSRTTRCLQREVFMVALLLALSLTGGIITAVAAMNVPPGHARLLAALPAVVSFLIGIYCVPVLVRLWLAQWLEDLIKEKN